MLSRWERPSERSLFQLDLIPAIRREIASYKTPFALRRRRNAANSTDHWQCSFDNLKSGRMSVEHEMIYGQSPVPKLFDCPN